MSTHIESVSAPRWPLFLRIVPTAGSPGMFLLHFVNDGLQASLLTALPLIAASLMLSKSDVGILTSAHFAMGILLAIPATTLLRKLSGEFLLAGALGIVGICFLGIAVTAGLTSLWIVFLLAGVGFGVFHPIAFAVLTQRATMQQKSSVMGWFTATGDIGRVAISSTFLLSASLCGWRGVAFTAGAMAIAATTAMLIRHPPLAEAAMRTAAANNDAGQDGEQRSTSNQSLLRNAAFIKTTCIGSLDAVANAGLVVFLPFVLVEAGVSPTMLPLLTGLFFTASIAGKVIMGSLADRVGNLRAIAICQAANIAGITCLLLTRNHVLLAIAVVMLGSTNKGSLPAILSTTARCVTRRDGHRAIGLNQLALGIATTVSPLLYGLASRYTDIRTACAAAAAASLAALVLSVHGK